MRGGRDLPYSYRQELTVFIEVRCHASGKLLGKAAGSARLQIKCNRCKCLCSFSLDYRKADASRIGVLKGVSSSLPDPQ